MSVLLLAGLLLSCGSAERHPVESHDAQGDVAVAPTFAPLPRPAGFGGAEECFNAVDDNDNHLIDEGCGVRQGDLQVVVAWPEHAVDVDLYVTDPKGEIASSTSGTDTGLAHTGDCPDETHCEGQNYESVYLEGDDLLAGTYLIRVVVEAAGDADLMRNPLQVTLGIRTPAGTDALFTVFRRLGEQVTWQVTVDGSPRLDPG